MTASPGGSAPEDSSGTRETGRGRVGSSVVDAGGLAGYGGPTSWRIRRQSGGQTVTVGTSWGETLGRSERGGRPAAGGGGFSTGDTPACCPGQRQAGGARGEGGRG